MEDKLGKKLNYDPEWKGPLKGRSCTDCSCLVIFLIFLTCWAAIGYYALINGDINNLLVPMDSEGRKCGVDSEVIDRPYLVFFDLTKCATVSAAYSNCKTPQVCVSHCPTSNFMYTLNSTLLSLEDLKGTMICKPEINLAGKNKLQLDNYVAKNKCASWYLISVSITKRCIPFNIWAEFVNATITNNDLQLATKAVQLLTQAERILKEIYNDVQTTRDTVLLILAISALISLFYIMLLKWFATPFAFLTIFGVCGLLGYTSYLAYRHYSVNKAIGWLIVSIVTAIFLAIILFTAICLRNKIRLACQLIKEASKVVTSTLSSLFFPIIPWTMQLFTLVYAVAVGLYLTSIRIPRYLVVTEDDNCVCPEELSYTNNSECIPEVFNTSCTENGRACTFSGCQLINTENPSFVVYMHAINVIGFFWLFFFVSGFGEMVLAGTFATWYWTFRKSDVPFFTMTVSIWRTFRYHMGTLAFGSLIITICRLIRLTLEWLDTKLKHSNNLISKTLLKCCKCCFWFLESFLKFLNRNVYIMCAIHGKGFCQSAREAFNLLMRNIVRVILLDKVTDLLLLLGKLFITGLATWTTWQYYESSNSVNYWQVPVILVTVGSYLIATVFFAVHSAAVNTLFLCFLEDCERNNGTNEKPYYMSRRLMKLLRRS